MGSILLAESRSAAGLEQAAISRHHFPHLEECWSGIALDPEICWQAIYSRDPRFDGRFFAGATTTKLYCRNVCAVPFARPANTVLFSCSAAAESAGFRPCKRCQPQAVPGTAAWLGTQAVVSRAIRLILDGSLNDGSVEQLAGRLGLGSRQLRRLFVQHLGVSPLKIATTHRIQQARKLIGESTLPMTEIAFHAGFRSIREFNHAIRNATGLSPSELRRTSGGARQAARPTTLELQLPYRRPFDWAGTIAFLKERAVAGVELVGDGCYRRTIDVSGVRGVLTVRHEERASQVVVRLETSSCTGLAQTVERVRRIFDLNANPMQIASHLSRDPKLRELIDRRPGLRIPGAWDGFEAAALAILGERLSAPGSRTAAARLVQTFGTPVDTGVSGLQSLFPHPEVLAAADLSKVGIDETTAVRLRAIAGATARGELSFAASHPLEPFVSQLQAVCDIDRRTANYIAMRAFGEPDAFPGGNLQSQHSRVARGSTSIPAQTLADAEHWRPWRAYAALYIQSGYNTDH